MNNAGQTDDIDNWEDDLSEWTFLTRTFDNAPERRRSSLAIQGWKEGTGNQVSTSTHAPEMPTNPLHLSSDSQAPDSLEQLSSATATSGLILPRTAGAAPSTGIDAAAALAPAGWEQAALLQSANARAPWPRSLEQIQQELADYRSPQDMFQPLDFRTSGEVSRSEAHSLEGALRQVDEAKEQSQFEQWLQSLRLQNAGAVSANPMLAANQGQLQPFLGSASTIATPIMPPTDPAAFLMNQRMGAAASLPPSFASALAAHATLPSSASASMSFPSSLVAHTNPSVLTFPMPASVPTSFPSTFVAHGNPSDLALSASTSMPPSFASTLVAHANPTALARASSISLPLVIPTSGRSSPRKSKKASSAEIESMCEKLFPFPNHEILKPLTAYNYFYRDERDNIVNAITTELDPFPSPVNDFSHAKLEFLLHQRWFLDPVKKKRAHRKGHGKLGFEDLSKTIAVRWRNLSSDGKAFYRLVAKIDDAQYKRSLRRAASLGAGDSAPQSQETLAGRSSDLDYDDQSTPSEPKGGPKR